MTPGFMKDLKMLIDAIAVHIEEAQNDDSLLQDGMGVTVRG